MALAEEFDTSGPAVWHQLHLYFPVAVTKKDGQCKSTCCCYNELVVANFRTGSGVKWQKKVKNIYLLTLSFIYKLAFILFVMKPDAQTIGNIAVYGFRFCLPFTPEAVRKISIINLLLHDVYGCSM